MERPSWDQACEEVELAHVAILKALHRFEIALLASTPRSDAWKTRVRRELVALTDVVEQHKASAAAQAGLIGFIESMQGHSSSVSELVKTHDALLRDARSLLETLGTSTDPGARHSPFKRAAARLASAVRAHEAQESELVYETTVRVSGGEG